MSISAAGLFRRNGVARERLLAVILAISVALNVCVVAGVLWSRFNPLAAPNAAERFRKLEASLNLDDQQRLAFDAYVAGMRARNLQLRRDIEPLLEQAWREIAKPQPDEAAVMQRFNDVSTRWRASQHETVDATLALLATLNPDQRAKFVAEQRERRAAMLRRHAEESR